MATRTAIWFPLCVSVAMAIACLSAAEVPDALNARDASVDRLLEPSGQTRVDRSPLRRSKRDIYLTFQDRAQAGCISLCMYHESATFFKCERKCKIGRSKRLSSSGKSRI